MGEGGGKKVVDRSCLAERAAERVRRIKAAAEEAGLQVGDRLRVIKGEDMFERWRWGRVPMVGGGWLVTFRHDNSTELDTGADGSGAPTSRRAWPLESPATRDHTMTTEHTRARARGCA